MFFSTLQTGTLPFSFRSEFKITVTSRFPFLDTKRLSLRILEVPKDYLIIVFKGCSKKAGEDEVYLNVYLNGEKGKVILSTSFL